MSPSGEKDKSRATGYAKELSARYDLLLECSRDVILFIREPNARIFEINAAAVSTYGHSREKLLGMRLAELRAPEARSQLAAQLKMANSPQGILFETVHLRKNVERFPVEVSSRGTLVRGERIYINIVRDISDRKRAEQKLRESEENMRALLNATRESFLLIDLKGKLLQVNEAGAKRLGWAAPESIIGRSIYELLPDKITRQRRAQAAKVVKTGQSVRFEDLHEGRYEDQVIYPVFDGKGNVNRLAVFGTDVTDFRKLEEKLRVMALTDELTGLYNRRGFFLLAERQFKISVRSGRRLTLLYMDLDGMKRINDSFGHDQGDQVLRAVAEILIETFRSTDIIARIGGDEFTVLAINGEHESEKTILERLQQRVDLANSERGWKFKISLSIGIAHFLPDRPSSLSEMIATADREMYKEKRKKITGRRRTVGNRFDGTETR